MVKENYNEKQDEKALLPGGLPVLSRALWGISSLDYSELMFISYFSRILYVNIVPCLSSDIAVYCQYYIQYGYTMYG